MFDQNNDENFSCLKRQKCCVTARLNAEILKMNNDGNICFKNIVKSLIFQAIKLLLVIVESVPVKMLRKNVRNRDFLIVYTRVRRNERVHGQKARFPGVYTPRNIEWKKAGHVHAEKYIFSGVYTTTFSTRV